VKVEFFRGRRLDRARGSSACFGSWRLNAVADGAPDQGTTEIVMNNGPAFRLSEVLKNANANNFQRQKTSKLGAHLGGEYG
jgi:hypothetical protein